MGRFLIIAVAMLAAAPASAASTATARLGQSVKVGPVRVAVLKVVEDSRCPRYVTCVWRGRLRIQARVAGTLRTLDDGQPVAVRGGRLTLEGATPLSNRGETVPPDAYRFAFRFQR